MRRAHQLLQLVLYSYMTQRVYKSTQKYPLSKGTMHTEELITVMKYEQKDNQQKKHKVHGNPVRVMG